MDVGPVKATERYKKKRRSITFPLQHSFWAHCILTTDRSWYLQHYCIDRFESNEKRPLGVWSTLEKVTGEKGKLTISSIPNIFSNAIQSLTRNQLLNTVISYSNLYKNIHWFTCLSSTLNCSDFKCIPFVRLKSLTENSYAVPKIKFQSLSLPPLWIPMPWKRMEEGVILQERLEERRQWHWICIHKHL